MSFLEQDFDFALERLARERIDPDHAFGEGSIEGFSEIHHEGVAGGRRGPLELPGVGVRRGFIGWRNDELLAISFGESDALGILPIRVDDQGVPSSFFQGEPELLVRDQAPFDARGIQEEGESPIGGIP